VNLNPNFRRLIVAILLGIALQLGTAVAAEQESESDVDYLDLAALMLRDGNLDRAMVALEQVDLEAEGVDLQRYYTLLGLAHLRRNELELARDALNQAAETESPDSLVFIYLAQVNFQLQDYRATIAALDKAGPVVERLGSVYHMRAQCYWLLEEPTMALATLDQAASIFPEDKTFDRRKVFYLIELGLFQEAAELGREYLEYSDESLEDYIALGNALRASGELEEAAQFLEQAQLRYPDNVEIKKSLAHAYIERGELSAAADLLYSAALLDPDLMAEAAELYRRAGQTYRALTLNGQLNDQPEKFRQRMAILLELQNFEQAAAMETPLYRVGLLQDEDLLYALAYAQFKIGAFEEAEANLSQLTRPDLFRKAAELRRAIQDCSGDSWQCL
jgi:tetratricopeptide (TPR) repeat protein